MLKIFYSQSISRQDRKQERQESALKLSTARNSQVCKPQTCA